MALPAGWLSALALAGFLSLVSAVLVSILYRPHPVASPAQAADRPRLAELGTFLRRPPILVVFGCGLALSIAQSSLLAYLVLYTKETFAVSVVTAAQLLSLAPVGGTLMGAPIVGVLLEVPGAASRPWLVLTAIAGAVVVTLPRLSPLVQRG